MHVHNRILNNEKNTLSKPVASKHADSVKAVLQAKLKIVAPNGKNELEADRVAEQVMRMPEPHLSLSVGDSSLAIAPFATAVDQSNVSAPLLRKI